jgi:hypothetical protein
MNAETQKYNKAQAAPENKICDLLARTIDENPQRLWEQDLAPAPRLVHRRQPDRWLQQNQDGHQAHVLERRRLW